MDAARMKGLVRPLQAACETELGIPGVNTIGAESSPGAARGPTLTASFLGWSPSLHRTWVQILGGVEPGDDGLDDEEVVERLLETYRPAFERQRRRADDAVAGGAAEPLGNGRIDHLMIDAAMAPLARDAGTDLAGAVRDAIGRLHGTSNIHRGGRVHSLAGVSVGESPRGDDVLRYVMPRIRIRSPSRRRAAVYTGHHVRIEGHHLPDTALASLVGRPLADLARLHPALDGRIVRKAANSGSTGSPAILVGIDQHLEPLARLIDI